MKGKKKLLIPLAVYTGFVAGTVRSVWANSDQPTLEDLYQKLEQRDALIFDLQQRVEQLEKREIARPLLNSEIGTHVITVQRGDWLSDIARKVYGDPEKWRLIYNANRSQLSHPDAIEIGMRLVIPTGGVIIAGDFNKQAPKEPVEAAVLAQQESEKKAEKKEHDSKTAQAEQKPAKENETKGASASNAQAKAAPGQFEVDEEAAERALERTLVQEGALLLPYGELELQPSFTYTSSENDHTIFVNVTDEDQGNETRYITSRKVRRDILTTSFAVRVGLPFNSQLELSIPYKYVDSSRISDLPASLNGNDEKSSDAGLGDLRVGIAKTFLREDGWWPDIIGRVTWDSATGEDDIGGLSNGFHEAGASLTFLKRQDPLAFVGSVGYQRAFKEDDFKPGDQLDFNIGATLAASPETSLRFFLSQSFVYESEIGNREIQGSDQQIGTLSIGASSIIGNRIFLNLSAGMGLTDDASDYSVGLSFSQRINWLSHF